MPSLNHEAILLLFRNRPELAPELLRSALGVVLPAYSEARLESAELTDVVPTEYRADLVVLLVEGRPVLGIVVEVQLRAEERKRYVWPVYATTLRARLECPACVLVVTPNEQVAEWAAAPLELGPNARMVLQVIGPSAVPIPRDAEHARNEPELAVLSALAHGRDPRLAETIATAAAAGVAKTAALDEDRALLYLDLVSAALGEAARAAFEALMATERYEYQSEFAKKYYGQGLAEGEVRGEARGEARGEGRAILLVLESRGVPISADHRRRVLECTDLTELERWLKRALTVSTSSELFTQ